MKNFIKKAPLLIGATVSLAFLSACGSKSDESTSEAPVCPATATGNEGGYVMCVGSAKTATLELGAGSYVVAPFVLGDHASVPGAGAQSFDFGITATSASLQGLKASSHTELSLDHLNEENLLRLVANRFDISKGIHQEAWLWQALDKVDKVDKARLLKQGPIVKNGSRKSLKMHSLRSHYESIAENHFEILARQAQMQLKTATLANCPSTVPTADGASTISLGSSYDGTSYCVGYETAPTNETKANIEAAVKTVIEAYKTSIYGDAMTSNVKDGYTFNPVIVFKSSLGYAGAFSKTATTVAKRPILLVDSSLSKATIYATIAHEIQHAIVDYYKARGTTTIEETVAIDEGVAHLMEDAFGYGEENFNSYVKGFLTNFPDGSAILANDSGANAAAARGGAYSLVYFMAIRAGGFTVTNGKPFSGPGFSPIIAMVKQTSLNGPAALASAFSQPNLVERVGQLIGALYADNLNFTFTPATFTSASYDSITDVLGATGLKFGLRYNSFYSYTTSTAPNTYADAKEGFSAKHYESYPVLVTPTAATSTVTITLPGVANTGVSVTRVK